MRLDLRDSTLREQAGLLNETVTLPSHQAANSEPIHRPSGETRGLIIGAIYSAGQELTRLEIARALGRKKTPWLTALIEDMVAAGALYRIHTPARNGVICYLYGVR